jgi:hypothetical protein
MILVFRLNLREERDMETAGRLKFCGTLLLSGTILLCIPALAQGPGGCNPEADSTSPETGGPCFTKTRTSVARARN